MGARDPWYEARKAPFEAFGILYYPLFAQRSDLEGITLDDADMAWAMTANANLEGTGYTLSQPSILSLAAYRHRMAELSTTGLVPAALLQDPGINPLADIKRLVPNVSAAPFYPDFPRQVMEIDEATFRYHQALHYTSTYGVELIAGLLGLDVQVREGWHPSVTATPKTREDNALVASKVLHVVVTAEDLRSVVEARLARATRMHPAEVKSALLVFADTPDGEEVVFPTIAFHENMMELIRAAAQENSATLTRVVTGLAQHPGDLLKATSYLVKTSPRQHLATRQKKAICRAFERFSAADIARNLADAGKRERRVPNFLSVERFAGPHLREACELVRTGKVVSWAATSERLWAAVEAAAAGEAAVSDKTAAINEAASADKTTSTDEVNKAWQALLAHYATRPGMLLRSLARLIRRGCPLQLLEAVALSHASDYSLPTLVRTLTLASEKVPRYRFLKTGFATQRVDASEDKHFDVRLCDLLRTLVATNLRELETPFAGKRVYLDTAGVSLAGSILMPNDTGNTGTAWPPVGIAFDLPTDKTVRFFTFWDDRDKRVDVDLHFAGLRNDGSNVSIGWNSEYMDAGLVTSGDETGSIDAVEYLDANMRDARDAGVLLVMQAQHIYCGASRWADINTCFSGALVVEDTSTDVAQYNAQNLLFRDDLTGEGINLVYAVVNFPGHYVRIVRGADMPVGDVDFTLLSYLAMLFEAQHATVVADPADADVRVCVGRSDDPQVVSFFDEGFYL